MKLVKPDLSYAEQILAYKREMEGHHVSFDGCAGLLKYGYGSKVAGF